MIPFLDLKAQYGAIGTELKSAVVDVLESGQYVLGEKVEAFEAAFAIYCGTDYAVAVNTGTSALHLALIAAGVGPGDEVVTVPMTFVATAAAIHCAGATPVFVDIDPETWTLDPVALEGAITQRTKAVIPVHLHGRVADMDPILVIARRHNLIVIEDAAQAHGAEYRGRRAGALADIGCFSFYPGKNLGACGEGGAIVTGRADFAERVRMLRDWGQAGRYYHIERGFNYRMDAIQGAILDVKLKHLKAWTEARQRIAALYDAALAGSGIPTPAPGGLGHVYHVYAVRVPARDRVREELGNAGIATGMHYPIPVHLQPAYATSGQGTGSFPVSERLAQETLSLPIFPEMTRSQVERASGTLIEICAKHGGFHAAAE